jgi:putative heme-binding domain-containing protein
VDEGGLRLIHEWIRRLPIHKDEQALLEKLRALDEPAVLAEERAGLGQEVGRIALAIARTHGRETVTPEDRQRAEIDQKAQAANRGRARAADRNEAVRRLLSSTSGALMLMHAFDDGGLPASVRPHVLAAVAALPDAQVRDLFERFLPDEQRVKRLGTVVIAQDILRLKGDPARGKDLFFMSAGLQCVNCHKVNGKGSNVGPDLGQIGKKYTRAQLLESILEPSKFIDPQYVSYVVATTDGQLHTGLLVKKTDKEVILRNAGDKETRIPVKRIEHLTPQKVSLMPEQLLRDLTAEQAADLVDYLATLK